MGWGDDGGVVESIRCASAQRGSVSRGEAGFGEDFPNSYCIEDIAWYTVFRLAGHILYGVVR